MMHPHGQHSPAHGHGHTRALPRKFIEPILYLGDRMVGMGKAPGRNAVLEHLAEAAGLKEYFRQQWFREMNDHKACEKLDVDAAKKGALVVLALLIKTDPAATDVHRAFFTKVRTMLEAEPISVPADADEHKRLALGYMRD
jgi:hypothetical protein